MLRRSLALSILASILVLTFGLLAVAEDTNTGDTAAAAQELPASPQVNVAPAAVMFDLSPGTGPPPPTLGGFTMTPVPFPGAPACTKIMPPGPIPTPAAGKTIAVKPWSGQRCIGPGAGWATWSHGYRGDVYFTSGATSQQIVLPDGTKAFYFYVEPNPFTQQQFEVIADGVSSGPFSAIGDSGAKYVGVYNPTGTVKNIEIRCSTDFASGEYGWAGGDGPCTGAIGGQVTDTRQKPLRAIVITVKLPEKDKAFAVSDATTGSYKIVDLPEGTYFVLCFKRGFQFKFAFPVAVVCDKTTIVNFQLPPALE